MSSKNHLYHTLSPVLLLASVVLLILTYLSPVLIFSDSVSLLHATIPVGSSSSANSSLARREWRSVAELDAHPPTRRMAKRRRAAAHGDGTGHSLMARATNKTASAKSTASSSSTVTVYFGPMGACHKTSTNSTLPCASPSFTPMFDELLDSLSTTTSSTQLAATLPSQFPLAPTGLFLSFLALACGFFVSLAHSSAHHVARLRRLQERAGKMRRLMVGAVGFGWVLGVVVTLCFFVQLRHDAKEFEELGVSGASVALGKGFQMLVATWCLSLVSLLLLGAETITNRAR